LTGTTMVMCMLFEMDDFRRHHPIDEVHASIV